MNKVFLQVGKGTSGNRKKKELTCIFFMLIFRKNVNVAKFSNEGTTFWHEIFSHLNMANLKKLEKMVNGINLKEVPLHHMCETCIEGKSKDIFS